MTRTEARNALPAANERIAAARETRRENPEEWAAAKIEIAAIREALRPAFREPRNTARSRMGEPRR